MGAPQKPLQPRPTHRMQGSLQGRVCSSAAGPSRAPTCMQTRDGTTHARCVPETRAETTPPPNLWPLRRSPAPPPRLPTASPPPPPGFSHAHHSPTRPAEDDWPSPSEPGAAPSLSDDSDQNCRWSRSAAATHAWASSCLPPADRSKESARHALTPAAHVSEMLDGMRRADGDGTTRGTEASPAPPSSISAAAAAPSSSATASASICDTLPPPPPCAHSITRAIPRFASSAARAISVQPPAPPPAPPPNPAASASAAAAAC
mmetsp:Transcript_1231/g.3933  ORF Transcript_1231/g.3933 Transcript_1231/m.3933 type:complete len:261 (+) Transcript_1231:191-973(+)